MDPPDVVKTQPCAKLEAWVDPSAIPDPKKAIEQIGKNLQAQYEVLSTRTKYKQSLDPNVEDAKRFCMSLRRSAREERILFHYNGHGVPRPTPSGEIWVFNRGYTQYIPVSVYDLQSWLGAPCIYAYDCHGAGHIVNNFNRFVQKRIKEEKTSGRDPNMPSAEAFENCIQLAACRAEETLPMHPELPADLFTCCITSPIELAVRWFVMQSPLLRGKYTNLTIPGKITDRRTPLGELNWIFTAITDTIAWSTLDSDLFKRLFRQDLVVAAMFRNFLLAVRVMRIHNCHPVSSPELPDTHDHPMWDAWDLTVDHCVMQLPMLQESERTGKTYEYKHSDFFEQQLTAFEIWLKYKSADLSKPPEQLPVLLQVLLSQIHRLRALILLSKYLDLGPKAVHLALSIGIFPYVLKLLQSPAPELKPVLVFIWARIMAVDYTNIQHELVKENGFAYFINILVPHEGFSINTINVYEHLAMCAFVIALFCRGHKQGKRLCNGPDLLNACLSHTKESESPLLRQWAVLCISQVWDDFPEYKSMALRENILDGFVALLTDPIPEVRTAILVALTTFLGNPSNTDTTNSVETGLAISVLSLTNDASPIVRREVVVFFSKFVKLYLNYFLVAAFSGMEEDVAFLKDPSMVDIIRSNSPAHNTIYGTVYRALLVLTEDPFSEVSEFAEDVVDYIIMTLEKTPLGDETKKLEKQLLLNQVIPHKPVEPIDQLMFHRMQQRLPSPMKVEERSFSSTLKRSVSLAASLKSLAWGLGTNNANETGESAEEIENGGSSGGRGGNSNGVVGHSDEHNRGITSENNQATAMGDNFANGHSGIASFSYGSGIKPKSVRYKPKDYSKEITLPLASGFFQWSCEYFQEPQMSQADSDEPGSERYVERVWRKSRNEKIIVETQVQKDLAVSGSWSTQVGFLNNITQPYRIVFAQFEPHLVAADDKDGITVWDWTEGTKLCRFCNSNPIGTKIREVKYLNEDDQPLLLTGSDEGVVRIYRHYDSPREIEQACSWRVLTDLLGGTQRNGGLVVDWQQSRGALIVGGDVKVVRVWDAPREMCLMDIPLRSSSRVTSLTSDQVSGQILVAGFADGALRVYDRRMDSRECLVRTWKKHDSSILKVHMQRGGARELVSGSLDGQVNLWDIRMAAPVTTLQACNRGHMAAMDVHEHAPVITTASQIANIWTTNGNTVSSVRVPSSGYLLGNRSVHVSSVVFHPHQMIMACNNALDANISLFNAIDGPIKRYNI